MTLVIDASVAISWCLSDEDDPLAELAMHMTLEHFAVVPRIWWYEVLNVLTVNRRRGRLNDYDVPATVADFRGMRILTDDEHSDGAILELAWRHRLVRVRRRLYRDCTASLEERWPRSTVGFARPARRRA